MEMKIAIIYGTKHGTSKKCAEILSEKIGSTVELFDAGTTKEINFEDYEIIIIGGSIHMGQMNKGIREFCAKNMNSLRKKRLGLFICGMTPGDKIDEVLNSAFPKELLDSAVAKEWFGGEFKFKEMNFFERFIIKKVSKSQTGENIDTAQDVSDIKEDNIGKLVKKVMKIYH